MDGYIITGFDQLTNAVYASFTYGDALLNETVFVSDLSDDKLIASAMDTAYVKFQKDIGIAQANQVLPDHLKALIGLQVSAKQASDAVDALVADVIQ